MRPPRGGGSFRGRGGRDSGGRGGGRHFGGGNRGGGRFGGGWPDEGPPNQVVVATFLHACEGDAVTKLCQEKISHFNAPIYLQNKTQIGKIDEIFGPINESLFSVKMMEERWLLSYILPLRQRPYRSGRGGFSRGRGRAFF
ncbi:BnaC09g39670D [Brassica napus]|uniref:H/ACA ribonucleoprotein complex subunit n=1 Tax=Brassica napus TaxID=3708 RepID=A0A078GJV5_BRANA|nr:BnaC09g39670D [Brassica napus]